MYWSTDEIAQTKAGRLEIDFETLSHGNELKYFFILAVLSQKSFQVNLLVNRFAEVLVTQETLFRSGIVILFLTHKFIHKNQED